MDILNAEEILADVISESGFIPTHDPNFRLLEPGNVRGIVAEGMFNDVPSFLKIIFGKKGRAEIELTDKIHRLLVREHISTPKILMARITNDVAWMIMPAVEGKRIIEDNYPHSTWPQKAQTAKAFWLMRKHWPQLEEAKQTPQNFDPALWFSKKIIEWGQIGKQCGAFARGLMSIEELLQAHVKIQEIVRCVPNFSMRFTHGHFSNDEIRVDEEERYWLIDLGHTSWRPDMYDAAFYVWRAGMYSWNFSPDAWLKELGEWERAFTSIKDRAQFHANLLERCIGALTVDIGQERGIVASLDEPKKARLIKNWRTLFLRLLEVA